MTFFTYISVSGVKSRNVRVGLTLAWVFFLQVNHISLIDVQLAVYLKAFLWTLVDWLFSQNIEPCIVFCFSNRDTYLFLLFLRFSHY